MWVSTVGANFIHTGGSGRGSPLRSPSATTREERREKGSPRVDSWERWNLRAAATFDSGPQKSRSAGRTMELREFGQARTLRFARAEIAVGFDAGMWCAQRVHRPVAPRSVAN